jgi:protease-4
MSVLKTIFKFAVRGFAVVGFVVILISAAGWTIMLTREKPKLPEKIILTLDLRGKIAEAEGSGPLGFGFDKTSPTLRDVVSAIDLASQDDRVQIVIGSFRDDGSDYPKAQEIRDAVYRLRSTGKMAFATATSFGELGPADRAYYTASAFSQIWLQPVGVVGLTGVSAQSPFLRGALDKVGATADFVHREEYKTAASMLTETEFSVPHAEMMNSLLDDISMQVVNDIAVDRQLSPMQLYRLIDHAPLTALEAKAGGLVDRIGYFDELADLALNRMGDNAELVPAEEYLSLRQAELKKEDLVSEIRGKDKILPTVAYIHAVGEIKQDAGGIKRGGPSMSADDMVAALKDAVNDKNVEAVLIRLDSPGGSAVASETIRYAMSRVRNSGLPLIISMGSMAGSGAYWMATEADYVVADPATLTGSIGVVAGKIAGTHVWNDLGIGWGMVTRGDNADMWSLTEPFTDAQRQRVDQLVGDTYEDFKTRVAEGRNMDMASVAAVAKGRVWTGNQALNLGLVDQLGGFYDALVVTKNLLGLTEKEKVILREFPEDDSLLTRIKKSISKLGQFGVVMESAMGWMTVLEPVMEPAARVLSAQPRQVIMPDVSIK